MERPLGPESPPGTAAVPPRTAIIGRHSTLVPFEPSLAASLFPNVAGPSNEATWDYLPLPNPPDLPAFEKLFAEFTASSDPLYFAITAGPGGDGEALGMISYLNIVPEHRRLEIGWVVFGEGLRRTKIATEAFYGLLRRAFDELGYLRVEWKCNHLNKASREAALRLGFQFEGTFRQHFIVKGRRRDSDWFSIIKEEWPAVKQGFERWLSDENFDEQGRQKRRLQECREG